MKTIQVSKKTLAIGSLLIGAMLVITPALTFAESFKYQNPGEQTFLNVTNNQDKANFTILGAFYTGSLPIVVNGTDIMKSLNITFIGGFEDLAIYNDTLPSSYAASLWHVVGNTSGYFEATPNTQDILKGLESTYLVTGSGNHDFVNVTGGLTNDIYSIVTPGNSTTVDLYTGAGSSTWAVQVGTYGTINISPSKALVNATTDTTNVFNIVYGNVAY